MVYIQLAKALQASRCAQKVILPCKDPLTEQHIVRHAVRRARVQPATKVCHGASNMMSGALDLVHDTRIVKGVQTNLHQIIAGPAVTLSSEVLCRFFVLGHVRTPTSKPALHAHIAKYQPTNTALALQMFAQASKAETLANTKRQAGQLAEMSNRASFHEIAHRAAIHTLGTHAPVFARSVSKVQSQNLCRDKRPIVGRSTLLKSHGQSLLAF